jgi:nitrite reductase/ring-hydroxylating ferredoxin subunit
MSSLAVPPAPPRAAHAAVDELLWFDSGVRLSALADAADHKPEYEYSVTGARRRKPRVVPTAAPELLPSPAVPPLAMALRATVAGDGGTAAMACVAAAQEARGSCAVWAHQPGGNAQLGRTTTVNGRDVVLFRWRDSVICTDARCPHAGGHLAGGDIEDYSGVQCVTCPVHGFLFSTHDGISVVPRGSYRLAVHPTQLRAGGGIFVGFPALAPALFAAPPDF